MKRMKREKLRRYQKGDRKRKRRIKDKIELSRWDVRQQTKTEDTDFAMGWKRVNARQREQKKWKKDGRMDIHTNAGLPRTPHGHHVRVTTSRDAMGVECRATLGLSWCLRKQCSRSRPRRKSCGEPRSVTLRYSHEKGTRNLSARVCRH